MSSPAVRTEDSIHVAANMDHPVVFSDTSEQTAKCESSFFKIVFETQKAATRLRRVVTFSQE